MLSEHPEILNLYVMIFIKPKEYICFSVLALWGDGVKILKLKMQGKLNLKIRVNMHHITFVIIFKHMMENNFYKMVYDGPVLLLM